MLFNRSRAESIVAAANLDALVATSPENVMYMTNYVCTTHWINKGFQVYALFAPASDPDTALIAPGLEADAIVDGNVDVDDIYLFSEFKRGRTEPARMSEVGREIMSLVEHAHAAASATDGLVAAIEARGLANKRVGLDESGLSVQALQEIRRRLPNLQIVDAAATWWEIRAVKTAEEIARIERATLISESAIRLTYKQIAPGVRECDLVDVYNQEIVRRGAKPTFSIICSGDRSSFPHAMVSDRRIEEGDVVRYDIGCTFDYYHSDNARAVVVGGASDEQQRIWDALVAGVQDATAQIQPGADHRELFETAMRPARKLGLDNFDRFHCGHGIGISVYDPPIITAADPTKSAFLMPDFKDGLVKNMVINIEVGYYITGLMGFLYEDTMVVTEDGCRVLTSNSPSLDLETFLEHAP